MGRSLIVRGVDTDIVAVDLPLPDAVDFYSDQDWVELLVEGCVWCEGGCDWLRDIDELHGVAAVAIVVLFFDLIISFAIGIRGSVTV